MRKIKTKKPAGKNPHVGSSLDAFLKEDGIYDEVVAVAAKKAIARQPKARLDRRRRAMK